MYTNLLPYPKQIELSDTSSFVLPADMAVTVYGGIEEESASHNRLNQIGSLIDSYSKLHYTHRTESRLSSCQFCVTFSVPGKEFPVPECCIPSYNQAYQMGINEEGIVICGNDTKGIFYGLTTLMQVIRNMIQKGVRYIAGCNILDWPSVEIRGHFDDISRKRISTVDDFKNIVNQLGQFKISHYGMYFEDVLHINAFPDIGRKRGKLMQGEAREIVAEAAKNEVEVIPFFQLIGHCENLLEMPNYRHLGKKVKQRMSSLDPNIPEVRKFLSICIQEVCALFPCTYFGMGFDETQGLDKDTYIRHANWCADELAKYGKKSLLWADMFQKTYGFDCLRELNSNIVIVNWQYGCIGEIPGQSEFEKYRNNVWGFGGYNSWGTYLPDFEFTKDHMDTWSNHFEGKEHAALFYSQWGDDGYENNRDLPWNLFAYAGETSWRGDNHYRSSFEERYIINMFGVELPVLKGLVLGIARKMNHTSGYYWNMHRENAFACIRAAYSMKGVESFLEDDKLFDEILSGLNEEFHLYKDKMRNHGQMIYRHFITYVDLLKLNARKMIVAFDLLDWYQKKNGQSILSHNGLVDEVIGLTNEIRRLRECYINDWMINNKREGVEVSTAVFDENAASFEEVLYDDRYTRPGYVPLCLSSFYNNFMQDIAGVPMGRTVLAGIPFEFAGADKTFIEMNSECPDFTIKLDKKYKVKDIHLIAASPMQPNLEKIPVLKITLLSNQKTIWEDTLNTTEHICDWWAPYNEHIWAGGGYQYVDKNRVMPACKPGAYYGLMITNRFPGLDVECDEIVFARMTTDEVAVFAVTVQI